MALRLRINGREQFAVDLAGNPMPVYIEDEPYPKPDGYVSIMICPDCNGGVLVKKGSGDAGQTFYRCSNSICDLGWVRRISMEIDIVVAMG